MKNRLRSGQGSFPCGMRILAAVLMVCLLFAVLPPSIHASAANENPVVSNRTAAEGEDLEEEPDDPDALTISGANYPTSLNLYDPFIIYGCIQSATSNITSVTVGIYTLDGEAISHRTVSPNATSYEIHAIDASIEFGAVTRAGFYYYRVMASNATHENKILLEQQYELCDNLVLENGRYPTGVLGWQAGFVLRGTVTSKSRITYIRIGIYKLNGSPAISEYIQTPYNYEFSLTNADSSMTFGVLNPGSYYFRIVASNASHSDFEVLNAKFYVKDFNHSHNLTHFDAQAPTCIAEGRIEYWYCSSCRQFLTNAEGTDEILEADTILPMLPHNYICVVTEPTCTEGGCTTYTCSACGDVYVENEIGALGHDYNVEVTEPTCTEGGCTTHTCTRCGDSYTDNNTAALGHLQGNPTIVDFTPPTASTAGGYDVVVYCMRCGAVLSREHIVIPPLDPPEPIETDALRIYSSISVGTDMVVTWSARKTDVANYERFWIEVVKHAPDGDETYLYGAEQAEAQNEGSSSWSCDFKHIFAKEMGVEIEARVYAEDANGQVYRSPAKTTNIRDYLGGRLTATNNAVSQRVLAADMLNYGAAAQLYMGYDTEHLVNEELTAEQLAKLDEYETKELPAVEKTNSNYRPEGQSNILFNSVSLDNEVILTLIVRAAEGADVKILMKDHETGTVLETLDTVWNGSNYAVDYSGIGADKMRVAYDFVARIDGAETGNVRTWSVEGYVGEIRSGSNQPQIDVANALLIYGDSAAAYFAEQ